MLCLSARPSRGRAVVAMCLALCGTTACQMLAGIEKRDAAPSSEVVRQCDESTMGAIDGNWDCIRWEGINYSDTVRVSGQFETLTPDAPELTRFDVCGFAPETATDVGLCEDCFDQTCERSGAVGFALQVARIEHAEIEWVSLGETTVGSMWLALSRRQSANVGTIPLLSWSLLVAYARSVGLDQSDDNGVLIASTKDCSGLLMHGIYVRAVADGNGMGVPFAMRNVSEPRPGEATDHSGFAGVLNVEPGWVTVQTYVEGGCLVGETSVFVTAQEIAFVDVVPPATTANGVSSYGCSAGAGGQGGQGQ